MKYSEVIEKLKQNWELRYYQDEYTFQVFMFSYTEDEEEILHPMVVKKLFKDNKAHKRRYGMEGNRETGWLDVELSKTIKTLQTKFRVHNG